MEVATLTTVIAIVLLILYWRGPNAVWGGATLGIITGFIVALITKDWSRMALIFSAGTFIGTFFEWIGRLASKWKRH